MGELPERRCAAWEKLRTRGIHERSNKHSPYGKAAAGSASPRLDVEPLSPTQALVETSLPEGALVANGSLRRPAAAASGGRGTRRRER